MSVIYDLGEATYHADRTTISSTGAKTLLRSPKQFRYQLDHPKQISAGPLGTLTHALVLGQPHDFHVKDWNASTKEGKVLQAEAVEQGWQLITRDDWELAHAMHAAVRSNKAASSLLSEGRAEVSAYATDPATGVAMRGRFDWWRDDDTIVDLKTAQDASPSGFARNVANFRYHLQDAWYKRLAGLNGRMPERFMFVVVEKDAPHLIAIYELDADALHAGDVLVDRALEVYRDCMEAEALFGPDAWPEWGRPGEVVETLKLPRWAYAEVDDLAWL